MSLICAVTKDDAWVNSLIKASNRYLYLLFSPFSRSFTYTDQPYVELLLIAV